MGFFGWVKPNFVLDGVCYEVNFTKRKKNRSGTLKVSLRARSRAEFEVVKESSLSGFAKSIGLSQEIQTGDPNFDDNCYIRTDSVRFTGALLQNVAVREQIQNLLRLGFDLVGHDGERIFASKSSAVPQDRENEQLIHSTVRALNPISLQIQNTRALGEDHTISGSTKGTIAYSTGIGSLVCGVILLIAGQSMYEPIQSWLFFLASLNYSVVIFLIYAFVMYLFLKGRSRSHQQFLTALFASLVGIPLLTFGALIFINGRNDPGGATAHDLLITDKYTSRKKKTTKYHVKYMWGSGFGSVSRNVTSAEYNRVNVGQSRIEITTKPGNLGYEWVVSTKIR